MFIPSGGALPFYFISNYALVFAVSILCCTPAPKKVWEEAKDIPYVKIGTVGGLLLMSICYIVGSSNHPFLYFNF